MCTENFSHPYRHRRYSTFFFLSILLLPSSTSQSSSFIHLSICFHRRCRRCRGSRFLILLLLLHYVYLSLHIQAGNGKSGGCPYWHHCFWFDIIFFFCFLLCSLFVLLLFLRFCAQLTNNKVYLYSTLYFFFHLLCFTVHRISTVVGVAGFDGG